MGGVFVVRLGASRAASLCCLHSPLSDHTRRESSFCAVRYGVLCIQSEGSSVAMRPHEAQQGAMDRLPATLAGACHCGAVRIYVRRLPRTVTSCNCSICRRYGALWAYYKPSSVAIDAPKGGLSNYSWNRRIRAYHRCKRCGCVTHYTYRKRQRSAIIAVNVANFDRSALVGMRIRHFDGAASWKFLD
jgi:hypothetical protein